MNGRMWASSGDLGIESEEEKRDRVADGRRQHALMGRDVNASHYGVDISVLLRRRLSHMKTFLPFPSPTKTHPAFSPADAGDDGELQRARSEHASTFATVFGKRPWE